jgi:hypothetical protein
MAKSFYEERIMENPVEVYPTEYSGIYVQVDKCQGFYWIVDDLGGELFCENNAPSQKLIAHYANSMNERTA